MALINCPHCGKAISDKASQCPHCKYNFKETSKDHKKDSRLALSLNISLITLCLIVMCIYSLKILRSIVNDYCMGLSYDHIMRQMRNYEPIFIILVGFIVVVICTINLVKSKHRRLLKILTACSVITIILGWGVFLAIKYSALIKRIDYYSTYPQLYYLSQVDKEQEIYFFTLNDGGLWAIIRSAEGDILSIAGMDNKAMQLDTESLYLVLDDNFDLQYEDSESNKYKVFPRKLDCDVPVSRIDMKDYSFEKRVPRIRKQRSLNVEIPNLENGKYSIQPKNLEIELQYTVVDNAIKECVLINHFDGGMSYVNCIYKDGFINYGIRCPLEVFKRISRKISD